MDITSTIEHAYYITLGKLEEDFSKACKDINEINLRHNRENTEAVIKIIGTDKATAIAGKEYWGLRIVLKDMPSLPFRIEKITPEQRAEEDALQEIKDKAGNALDRHRGYPDRTKATIRRKLLSKKNKEILDQLTACIIAAEE